jgi:hypothetical protein
MIGPSLANGSPACMIIPKATSTFIERDRVATDEHRQLGDTGRDPPCFVFAE